MEVVIKVVFEDIEVVGTLVVEDVVEVAVTVVGKDIKVVGTVVIEDVVVALLVFVGAVVVWHLNVSLHLLINAGVNFPWY